MYVYVYAPFAPLGLIPLSSVFFRVFRAIRDSDKKVSEARMTRKARRDAEGRGFLCMYTSVVSEILDREGGTLLDLIQRALHQYKNQRRF